MQLWFFQKDKIKCNDEALIKLTNTAVKKTLTCLLFPGRWQNCQLGRLTCTSWSSQTGCISCASPLWSCQICVMCFRFLWRRNTRTFRSRIWRNLLPWPPGSRWRQATMLLKRTFRLLVYLYRLNRFKLQKQGYMLLTQIVMEYQQLFGDFLLHMHTTTFKTEVIFWHSFNI